MGADLFLAFIDWPEDAITTGEARIAALTEDDLLEIVREHMRDQDYESWGDYLNHDPVLGDMPEFDPDDEDEPSAAVVADYLRRALLHALHEVEGRRDTTVLTVGGRDYLFTGGLSWGDEPSDAYPMVCLLGNANITTSYPKENPS